MAELFREFFWLIFPVMGMIIAIAAIWLSFHHRNKALDVLKAYAVQGQEPPAAVMNALAPDWMGKQSGKTKAERVRTVATLWANTAVCVVMAAGFGYLAYTMPFLRFPFTIVTFSLVAGAVYFLITVLFASKSAPKNDE